MSTEVPRPPVKEYRALWDTGATGFSITKRVIAELQLKPIRPIKVYNAHGEWKMKDAFLINIGLPCNVSVGGILAAEGSFGENKDVLIGMDLISLGDFAISNFGNKTTFSFRIPSFSQFELKSAPSSFTVQNPHIGRNDPCPCKSGKKFKQCCMNKKV